MSEKVMTVDKNNFEKEVLNSDIPVLVDFWAVWCGPCRMVAPVVEQLADQYVGKIKFVKLNVDENPEIAARYNIMSIPSIYLFKNGEHVDGLVGARPKQQFEEVLNKYV
jgi:thioredoxin 1